MKPGQLYKVASTTLMSPHDTLSNLDGFISLRKGNFLVYLYPVEFGAAVLTPSGVFYMTNETFVFDLDPVNNVE